MAEPLLVHRKQPPGDGRGHDGVDCALTSTQLPLGDVVPPEVEAGVESTPDGGAGHAVAHALFVDDIDHRGCDDGAILQREGEGKTIKLVITVTSKWNEQPSLIHKESLGMSLVH